MNEKITNNQKGCFERIVKLSITACCFTLLGAAIGLFLISDLIREGLFTSWEALGSPPEPAEKIVYAHVDRVEVQTTYGNIYALDITASTRNWVQIERATPKDPYLWKFEASLARPLNRKVLDQIAFTWKPEFFFDIQYAISEDRMVFRWQGPGGLNGIVFGTLYGCLGGLLIGLIIIGSWISIQPVRIRSKKKEKAIISPLS